MTTVNTYRPFRDSDYMLTEWFADYVRRLILQMLDTQN